MMRRIDITAGDAPGSVLQRVRRSLVGVRARVVTAYVLLMAAAIITMTLVVRQVLYAQLDDDIEEALAQEIQEVERLASGNDPETGEPFGADVASVFDTFLSRSVPSSDEAFFTLVGGAPYKSTFAPPAQLLDDASLVEQWASLNGPTRADVDSGAGDARTLAVPILAEGMPVGTFVVAVFSEPRKDAVDDEVAVVAVVGAIVLAVWSLVAWSIAGRVLRPVRELTRTAQRISDTDFSTRIPVRGDDELARLGETFNAMMGRLESAFRSQRAFMSDVAHELRTPITIARGHLELLGDDPDERADTVALVTEELDRMSRYVDDLLLLAKAEQPDFLRPEPIDYGEFVTAVAARAAALGEREWTVESAPGPGRCVGVADPERLSQAVMNLVVNAVQHTGTGNTIALGVRCDGDLVELSVRDDGPGIEPSVVDSLFQRRRRGEQSRAVRPEGSGLGLAIVEAIARAHGGEVDVSSVPGQGATFTITVPLFAVIDDDVPDEEEEG